MIALVPFAETHLDATYRWMQDPAVRAGILFDRTIDPAVHRRWYAGLAADATQKHYAALEDGAHIGNFGYREIDAHDRRASLWMYLGAEQRGRGAGFQVLQAGLEKGFGELNLRKIVLIVRTDNAPAVRIYRKAGFFDEGVLKGEVLFQGEPVDVLRMAKLRP